MSRQRKKKSIYIKEGEEEVAVPTEAFEFILWLALSLIWGFQAQTSEEQEELRTVGSCSGTDRFAG